MSTANPPLGTMTATPVAPQDSPRRIRRDMHFVRWYAHTIKHIMRRYRDDATTADAAQRPEQMLARVEREVAAECRRMRSMFGAILAVLLMPFLLAGFLWSGMYWLPVRILWFPFERDMYGLPLFSVYEWFAFLFLAAFLVYAAAMLVDGFSSTRRVSTDFRHLAQATPAQKAEIARVAVGGAFPRTEYLLGRAKPFAEYQPLLAEEAVARGGTDDLPGEATA